VKGKKMIIEIMYKPTKNSNPAKTMWEIYQRIDYPSIQGSANYPQWEREQVTGNWTATAEYHFALLRSDYDPATAENSRKDHAGYDNNPGSLTVRGVTMGEITGTIKQYGDANPAYMSFTRCDRPTDGQISYLEQHFLPGLVEGILFYKKQLQEDATKRTIDAYERSLSDLKEQIVKLEIEKNARIEKLLKNQEE
jgi:hypothetical protein